MIDDLLNRIPTFANLILALSNKSALKSIPCHLKMDSNTNSFHLSVIKRMTVQKNDDIDGLWGEKKLKRSYPKRVIHLLSSEHSFSLDS